MLRTRTRTENPSRPTSARGSVGSARVWDESTRAARRAGAEPGPPAGAPVQLLTDQRLADLIGQAVQGALSERPATSAEERSTLALELQARILAWLSLGPAPLVPEAPPGPAAAHTAPAEAVQLPPEAPGAAPFGGPLAQLLRERLLRFGEPLVSRSDLLERLIGLALTASTEPPPVESPASPQELERLELLRRRLSKLERSLQEARSALVYVSGLETVETGIASIYRAVQGLAREDPLHEQKCQALELLFQANLELQKPGR